MPLMTSYLYIWFISMVRKEAARFHGPLMSGDWMPLLKLIAVGDRLLGNLVQAGWIARRQGR